MISKEILENGLSLQPRYANAELLPHIAIDNFFEIDVAQALLNEFPPFKEANALNEHGQVGPKCVYPDIKSIGPNYAKLHEYISSDTFLKTVSAITGIPDLLPDPYMYGGGTHENIEGAELDVHVDFNYDAKTGYHRRLNVLFYLNKEWHEDWGGAIEFHSNPAGWRRDNNRVLTYNCIFNRCVIFSTSETSWHGFRRIKLPNEKKGMSRKLISIYLFTKERPTNEIAPSHGTFYFPYPPKLAKQQLQLGKQYVREAFADSVVAQPVEEYEEMLRLIEKRDNFLVGAYAAEKNFSGRITNLHNYIKQLSAAIHPAVHGYANIEPGKTSGYFHDRWVASKFSITLQLLKPLKRILVKGWARDNTPIRVNFAVNGLDFTGTDLPGGSFEIPITLSLNSGDSIVLSANSSVAGNTTREKIAGDERGELYFILSAIVLD